MEIPFDKIYYIHLVDNTVRENGMHRSMDRIDAGDKFEIHWTCKKPVSNKIGDWLEEMHDEFYDGIRIDNKDTYGNVFNCAMEHYNLIKTSYQRGFTSIMIMEDDASFVEDIDLIKETFDKLPENYVCVKFITDNCDWNITGNEIPGQEFSRTNIANSYNKLYSAAAYCLDREGMRKYIEAFDRQVRPADMVMDDFKDDIYITKKVICKHYYYPSSIVS